MKFVNHVILLSGRKRRSPCGERGLKFVYAGTDALAAWSLPVRGAWIEILKITTETTSRASVAPRAGSVD